MRKKKRKTLTRSGSPRDVRKHTEERKMPGRNPDGMGEARPLEMKYRTDDDQYDYIARFAWDFDTQQAFLDSLIFTEGWRERLAAKRKEQRAAGIPDFEFLHNKRKQEAGIPSRPGRRSHRDREMIESRATAVAMA
jgi:hypothetical protein